MLRHFWTLYIRRLFRVPRPRRKDRPARYFPALEGLSERILPAVTATFVPSAGFLTVFGDSVENTITVSRDVAGKILVNGGAVRVNGGTPTVANTALVQV